MNCPNCGAFNNGGKFCTRCGHGLEDIQSNTMQTEQKEPLVKETYTQPTNNMNYQNDYQTRSNTTITNTVTSNTATPGISITSYFFIILAVIMKPFTAFKEELNKFNELKNSAIISLIVSGGATLINLVTTIFNSIRVKTFDFTTGKTQTTWVWENMKNIDYVELIGKSFLIYLGIIVGIAAVYYVVSLILKKQPNFSRLLGISALVVVPMLVSMLVLAPLLSLIWADLFLIVSFVGTVYTFVLLYEGMNSEILFEGNLKYYFNLICYSVLFIVVYFIVKNILVNSITSGLGGMTNMFS